MTERPLRGAPSFLAVDWGTTNRRIYSISGNAVVAADHDARGAATVHDYPGEIASLRERFGDVPMLLAGMVGSTVGWRQAPYVESPAGLSDIAAAITRIDARTFILPGLSFRSADRGDVMRGEEVQLLGAVEAALVPSDGLLCQPGTHCKWARVRGGKVQDFTTSMTGELFALLRSGGLLASELGGVVADGRAFRAGVREGRRRDLAASLFGIRADILLGLRAAEDAASFASGLLIGADVAARLEEGAEVHILAEPALGGLYATAIRECGHRGTVIDSREAFVAGITRIWDLLT